MCGSKKSAAPQIIYVPEPVYVPQAAAKSPDPAPEVSGLSEGKERRRNVRRGVGSLISGASSALTSSPSATPGVGKLG